MKSFTSLFVALIILALAGAFFLFFSSRNASEDIVTCTMDALICPDGTAVGRTGPNCSFAPCPTPTATPVNGGGAPDDIDNHIASKANLIVVTSPVRDAAISSPVTITGKARGYWFFEATFPITVVDWDGRIIGEGFATADGEWMTEAFVPFTATVNFTVEPDTAYRRGALILHKSNASGLPEHDDALEIPVTFN